MVRQGARIAPRQFKVLPALGPKPLQRGVERIVLFVDLEHDQDRIKRRDEKADGPGEPEDLILAAAVHRGRVLDRQQARDNQGPDRDDQVPKIKHRGVSTGPILKGSQQFEVAQTNGILASLVNRKGRQNRVEPLGVRRSATPFLYLDGSRRKKCLGCVQFRYDCVESDFIGGKVLRGHTDEGF